MKKRKILAYLMILAMVVTSCAAPNGAADESAGGGSTGPEGAVSGTSADAAAGGSSSAGSSSSGTEQAKEKPDLVIIGQEDGDYMRAVKTKKTEDADAKTSALQAAPDIPNLAGGAAKDYTVMVYIVGSNLESRYGAATNDIREMIGSGLDYSKNNLLVYTGGSKRWVSDISNTCNSVLNMADGAELKVMARTQETADMGAPESLAEFINYCTENFPAKHYGLVLWDHGAGPLWGYGSDELFGNDSLLMEELRTAMDKTEFGQGKKLDWVGFDACLMGSIESAMLWKDYADYLVGSEELEPGRGWDYSFLSTLNGTDDALSIVRSIVEAYGKYYEENRSEYFNPDVTLSAMDLSAVDGAVESVDTLFEAMQEGIGNGAYASINKARGNTKSFGLGAASGKEDAYDLLDIRDLARNVSEMYPEESAAVQSAMDKLVVSSASNISGAGGVSVYLPGDNRELYEVSKELYAEDEAISGSYGSFVNAYMDAWMKGNNTEWELAEIQEENGELTLQLSQDQVDNASEICYSVLQRNSFGDFAVTTGRIRLEPDENNVVHIPSDPMLVAAETDMEEPQAPLTCAQIETGDGESVYRTVSLVLEAGHEFRDVDLRTDEEVVITAKNRDGEREAEILDITSASGSAWSGGKSSVDVSRYESLINAGSISKTPVRDEEGHMKPFTEWPSSGYEMYPMCLDKGFRIIMKPASEFDHEFICQVSVKDVNGKVHASEYRELPGGSKKETVEIATENGTLYAQIIGEEACIAGYDGQDETLEIPETVDGRPVTEIGPGAFNNNRSIKEITVPDTVTEIGDEAFRGTQSLTNIKLSENLKSIGIAAFARSGITQISIPQGVATIKRGAFMSSSLTKAELPEGVSAIGSIPFAECKDLEEISIGGSSQFYKTVNGALYTKDGKTLIQYPCSGADECIVEEGTEVIGYGAFIGSGIKNVVLPSTLKTIENAGFYGCTDLLSLSLPDSLETVGEYAFSSFEAYYTGMEEDIHLIDMVRIGPNVSYIGRGAFDAVHTKAFEVDESNQQFASLGGFITNKAKDTIIAEPRGMESPMVIPEGITTLTDYQFSFMNEGTEFVLPDSLFRMGEIVFPYKYGEKNEEGRYTVIHLTKLHCSEGSAAEKYARMYDIPYDNIMDRDDLVFEDVTEVRPKTKESGEQTLTWRVYSDHAELLKWVSKDRGTIHIPPEYEGRPVTALSVNADDWSYGPNAAVKAVIPDTVKTIDWNFFKSFENLEEIEIDGDSGSFTCVDGILFSKDMKTLIGYPRARKGSEYEVPAKVESVTDKAFYQNSFLEKVTLPRSLESIGGYAFSSCYRLTEVVFQRGLREIGDHAFFCTDLKNVSLPDTVRSIGGGAFTLTEEYGTLILPGKLETVGFLAFSADLDTFFRQESIRIPSKLKTIDRFLSGVLFERYEVDEKNAYYMEKDGLLMSKDGKTLLSVPTLREGEFTVPEGTLYIDYDAFYKCSLITDIYIPDSVLDIGSIAEKDYNTGEYIYTIHCHEGTEAQKQLGVKGVPWVAIE